MIMCRPAAAGFWVLPLLGILGPAFGAPAASLPSRHFAIMGRHKRGPPPPEPELPPPLPPSRQRYRNRRRQARRGRGGRVYKDTFLGDQITDTEWASAGPAHWGGGAGDETPPPTADALGRPFPAGSAGPPFAAASVDPRAAEGGKKKNRKKKKKNEEEEARSPSRPPGLSNPLLQREKPRRNGLV
jgi:hypothetical protein